MVAAHMSARRQCQRRFKHTADLVLTPPWRATFESSALRGIFMDNLQAAMDAVTVQAIRRREVCRSSRPREGPASWPSAFGHGQIDLVGCSTGRSAGFAAAQDLPGLLAVLAWVIDEGIRRAPRSALDRRGNGDQRNPANRCVLAVL